MRSTLFELFTTGSRLAFIFWQRKASASLSQKDNVGIPQQTPSSHKLLNIHACDKAYVKNWLGR